MLLLCSNCNAIRPYLCSRQSTAHCACWLAAAAATLPVSRRAGAWKAATPDCMPTRLAAAPIALGQLGRVVQAAGSLVVHPCSCSMLFVPHPPAELSLQCTEAYAPNISKSTLLPGSLASSAARPWLCGGSMYGDCCLYMLWQSTQCMQAQVLHDMHCSCLCLFLFHMTCNIECGNASKTTACRKLA